MIIKTNNVEIHTSVTNSAVANSPAYISIDFGDYCEEVWEGMACDLDDTVADLVNAIDNCGVCAEDIYFDGQVLMY